MKSMARKPFLMISGDFTPWGGMDRPNYELAWHLADQRDTPVHLVGYSVASRLAEHPNVTWHRVPKPLNRYALAGPLLKRTAKRVAARLIPQQARVIANGGNHCSPDVNWVHAVQAAWNNRDGHAPWLFRLRAAGCKAATRRSERAAVRSAGLVLTNSNSARSQIIEHLGVCGDRVRTVYYGIDPVAFCPVSPQEKREARERLGWPVHRPVAVFIGALGHDRNKGFDILFEVWDRLCRDPAWNVDLVAAGAGQDVEHWRQQARDRRLVERVRMLGFTKQINDVLAAADVLVSPTHYDAYGQGVHEAICRGVPALVTRVAGVAERYPGDLADLLLNAPPSVDDVVQRLRCWRADMDEYRNRILNFSEQLRRRSWTDMAEEIVECLENMETSGQRRAA